MWWWRRLKASPILVTSHGRVAGVNVTHALVELVGMMLRIAMNSGLLVKLPCCRIFLSREGTRKLARPLHSDR